MKIVAVAIRNKDGLIFSLPPPARHHNVIHLMARLKLPTVGPSEQGFLTSNGNYVDREIGRAMAILAGQITEATASHHRELFSEDIW